MQSPVDLGFSLGRQETIPQYLPSRPPVLPKPVRGTSPVYSATILSVMRAKNAASMAPRTRAVEKQRARRFDERAISGGGKSVAQLKRENEVFAPLAADARIELAASRSLG